ncbi:hypothetical protein FACS1894132_06100 [Clostridia bacterium]|nr:hypothetical protein FACS1894132_06100 [Clostridia bacterium]
MAVNELIAKLNAVSVEAIRTELSTQLLNYIKYGNDEVKRVFFGNANGPVSSALQSNDFEDFPRIYVCSVLSKVVDYNFGSAVRDTRLQVQSWLSRHHQTIGEKIVLDFFGTQFSSYVNSETANSLKTTLCENSFITGTLVDALSNSEVYKIRNYWLMMKRLDASKLEEVMNVWRTTAIKDVAETFSAESWFDWIASHFYSDGDTFATIFNNVRTACNSKTLTGSETSSDVVGSSPSGAPFVKHYVINKYTTGLDVKNWIEKTSGYATGASLSLPESREKTDAPNPLGCIVAGTKIRLNTGKLKSIENIKANDQLLNENGFSFASGELVVSGHVRMLYSLNDDIPFMSPDHVILTPNGFKCLDPSVAKLTNPALDVDIIKENDTFYRVITDNNGNISFTTEIVKKINVIANNGQICYDIHISDGKKTYITENGYVCLANYPEITAKTVVDGLRNANCTAEFMELVGANQCLFEAAFGKVPVEYLLNNANHLLKSI